MGRDPKTVRAWLDEASIRGHTTSRDKRLRLYPAAAIEALARTHGNVLSPTSGSGFARVSRSIPCATDELYQRMKSLEQQVYTLQRQFEQHIGQRLIYTTSDQTSV